MGQRLGQHFLVNKNKIKKIVEALELKNGDVVVEIGAGHGELTTEIRNKKLENRIIAIEKDKMLASELKKKFENDKNIEIIEGDVLRIIPKLSYELPSFAKASAGRQVNSYKLTGNIPYYITGKLLRILSELENKPLLVVLTIQKEVAERICAKPAQMNLLAAITQFWTEPKIIEYISKKDFRPAPKIDSAIIQLTTYNQQLTTEDADKYYKFARVLFKQPRKTIFNNLRPTTNDRQLLTEKLKSAGVNNNDRSQNLSLEQIRQLSTLF